MVLNATKKTPYAVMLSSTYKELVAHREAVRKAMLGQRLMPVGMEDDTALPDKELISASLSRVEESDAYVGLIGYRYGHAPHDPHRNPDGLSLTELEFRRAVEREIPICMFIMHDDHPVPRRAVREERGAQDRYDAFIKLAKAGRIYAEFTSVDDLKAKAVQSVVKLREILESSAVPTMHIEDRTPRHAVTNIPSVPRPFLGREENLVAMQGYLVRAGRPIPVVIEGGPGTGKTMLATAYADLHRNDYRATWLVRAHSRKTLRNDLLALGVHLGWITGKKGEAAVRTVVDRLSSDGSDILLIYNDANIESELSQYIPIDGHARVIITAATIDFFIAPAFYRIELGNEDLKRERSVADCFLSYSTADESIARNVAAILVRGGYSVFAQFKDIPVGSNFVEEMKWGLRSSRIVALLSPAYESSQHCQAEWNAAYANDPDGSKRKLIPLLVEPTELNFLARQVVYANLVGLSNGAFEQRILDAVRGSTAATVPIKNIVSPVRHEWTADAKLTVQHSALPQPAFGRGPGDLSKQLATAKTLAKRLADQSASPQFNHSKQYTSQFTAYLNDLPTSETDGNIYLADAAARTLREMFAAEADILSLPFAAPLKTFLECHVGMRAYYPELSEFYASVRDGVLTVPLSLDAVERVRAVIDKHTPDQFHPSVGRELAKEEASAPPIVSEREGSVSSSSVPQPPPDPIGTVDRAQSRDQLVARSLNGLWSAFLKGKDIVPNIEGWRRAYESLEPTIRPVLDYLRRSLGD